MIGQARVTDQITEIVPRMRRGKVILCYPAKWEDVKQTGTVWLALGGDTPLVQRGVNLEPGEKYVLDELSTIFEVEALNGIKATGTAYVTYAAPGGVEL